MPPHDEFAEVLANLSKKVQARMEEVQRLHGYVDEAGEPSMQKVKDRAYHVLLEDCIVTSKAERSKKALSKGELYFKVYAREDAPAFGVQSIEDLDTVEAKVYDTLASVLWDLTQGSRSGWIQKRLGEDESTLVLCRRKIHRPTEAMLAVYLTDNENLIREDSTDKVVVSLMKRASVIRRDIDMVLGRHPKLRGPIAAQLASELKKVVAELTLPDAAQAELEAGDPAEPKVPVGV
jgi:hypothetical protein